MGVDNVLYWLIVDNTGISMDINGDTSGNLTWPWEITMFNGNIHYKVPFSIAMLNYQKVNG